jgi:hypothetical protein
MKNYRCMGLIHIEGTNNSAEYDFDMEWHDLEPAPNEIDILRYMMENGIIQILTYEAEAA